MSPASGPADGGILGPADQAAPARPAPGPAPQPVMPPGEPLPQGAWPATSPAQMRQASVSRHKRELILQAARTVFERDGLHGANMRAIAREAGYAVGALYNHYPSKDALCADLLASSLRRLGETLARSCPADASPAWLFESHALALYGFYRASPQELELAFRSPDAMAFGRTGHSEPAAHGTVLPNPDGGVSVPATAVRTELARPDAPDALLAQALAPMQRALVQLGAGPDAARQEVAALCAQALGLLLLDHAGRLQALLPAPGTPVASGADALFRRGVAQLLERWTV